MIGSGRGRSTAPVGVLTRSVSRRSFIDDSFLAMCNIINVRMLNVQESFVRRR